MRAWAVIVAFEERASIADAVRAAPPELCEGVVVVDGGSRDGTAEAARGAGAQVVVERRRGYGRAMMRGLDAARERGAVAYVCFDGNGAARAEDVRRVLVAICSGRADVAVGSRRLDTLRPAQRVGNRLAVWAIERRFGVRFRDVGAIRAFTHEARVALGLREETYGWPLELLLRAARRGLRTQDVAVRMQARGGRSKVSGTLRGTAGAAWCFLRLLATELPR